MIWLYERGPEVLRIETRFVQATNEFELIWHRPDGTSESERFATEATFRARLESVEGRSRRITGISTAHRRSCRPAGRAARRRTS